MFTATQLQALIAAHRDEFFKDLASIIAIPSVKGPAAPHAPFGLAPRQVLDAVVALGQAYGFKAQVVSDAMAYVQWGDNDQNYLGVVGHLDVVAAGDGWTSDPITLTKRGDRWYARGVLDNKGPAISCLFGLKLLKDAGLQPQRTIRLIFGSDEESGSADVPMYLAQEAPPTFAGRLIASIRWCMANAASSIIAWKHRCRQIRWHNSAIFKAHKAKRLSQMS